MKPEQRLEQRDHTPSGPGAPSSEMRQDGPSPTTLGGNVTLDTWFQACAPRTAAVQPLSHVRLCDPIDCSTPGLPVHHQLPEFKLMSIESMMPSNHLILCRPRLLLPSIFPSIRVFSYQVAKVL